MKYTGGICLKKILVDPDEWHIKCLNEDYERVIPNTEQLRRIFIGLVVYMKETANDLDRPVS